MKYINILYLVRLLSKRNQNQNITVVKDLPLFIKKITNIIIVLIPIANVLNNSRFSGSSFNENITINDLYDNVDKKVEIIVSLLNRDNTQLISLDKQWDKLYSLVITGINRFQPPTMVGGYIEQHVDKNKVIINQYQQMFIQIICIYYKKIIFIILY